MQMGLFNRYLLYVIKHQIGKHNRSARFKTQWANPNEDGSVRVARSVGAEVVKLRHWLTPMGY